MDVVQVGIHAHGIFGVGKCRAGAIGTVFQALPSCIAFALQKESEFQASQIRLQGAGKTATLAILKNALAKQSHWGPRRARVQ